MLDLEGALGPCEEGSALTHLLVENIVMPHRESGGGTALITGAARGIGAAFAQQLASRCKRLILVDKDQVALESMAESLAGFGPAAAEPLAANLARSEDQERVIERIEREDGLCLLVNNAGFGDPNWFYEQAPQVQCDMLQVHVVAAVRFCRAALPGMLRLGRGDIINVSSLVADLPVPGNVMYGATKGFLRIYSKLLRVECAPEGVNVQLLCPGYTRTGFHDAPSYKDQDVGHVPGWMWSPAEAVAESSLRALARRKFVCVPGWFNWSVNLLLRSRLVPDWVIQRLLV